MIIHAPHQLPHNIRYTIFCSKDTIKAGNKKNTASTTPSFAMRIVNKLKKISVRLLHLEQQEIQDNNLEMHFVETHRLALQLQTILTKYSPSSTCLGLQSSFSKKKNGHSILLFDWNWRQTKKHLIDHGWKPENIFIMPVPEGDYWAFWNNSHLFLTDHTGNVDDEKTLAGQNFSQFLTSQCIKVPNALTDNQMEYRRYTDSSPKGLERGHQLFPFPSFADKTVQNNREKIQQVINALSDSKSKTIYESVLYGEPTQRFSHYFTNTLAHLQYFDYIKINPGDCIINAGVASGFEIPYFTAHLNNNGQLHCIDPDGFDHLSSYVRTFHDEYKHLLIEHRYVLCDRSTGKPPQPTLGDFSNYSPMTVDDLVESNNLTRVDFVKMDIESMEALALEKISHTIQKFRPQLAIAVYHEIEHFWELPLRIIEMCKDYHFYFNIYSPTHFEGIFYAIPKERCVS